MLSWDGVPGPLGEKSALAEEVTDPRVTVMVYWSPTVPAKAQELRLM